MLANPFIYGNPVTPADFIGRRKEVRRIVSRLVNKGQSTAIIGDPHVGKTSLLAYLAHPATRCELYGADTDQWHFAQVDIQLLGSEFTPAQFWELALAPLQQHFEQDANDALLAKQYAICAESHFGNPTLENFFSLLKQAQQRLILVIDEFDVLLNHPVLNKAEFYSGQRSLSSRSEGAFAMLIASRLPLAQLNTTTQPFKAAGSPFFNFFAELTLGALADEEVAQLLARAGDRFTASDQQIIRALAGSHPYLLQAAAAALWDAYKEEKMIHTEAIRRYVATRLYRKFDSFFSDTWQVWSPEMRKAFAAIALAHQATLLPETTFRLSALLKDFHYLGPETGDLEERGLIVKDARFETGYRISAGILLAWLADEMVKVLRTDQPFDKWLQENHIDGAFPSAREKNAFKKAVTVVAKALGPGATAIIEALAKKAIGM